MRGQWEKSRAGSIPAFGTIGYMMVKKIVIITWLFSISIILGQDITIFFLKDGSILQGKIVNENQHRIFLKTDQGTIKIIPSDILGREDTAAKGDLTFFSDRLEQLQSNVAYITGKVQHMNDSIRYSIKHLNDLVISIEAIQNEFEIELLRVQSKSRQHNQSIEYHKDDLINNRVQIAENRQQLGTINDTLNVLNKDFVLVKEKSKINADQSYLLSGSLSTIKKDIQSIKMSHENNKNQIDMMAGALANNIQEVIRVQGKFSDVEKGLNDNLNSINDLNRSLIIQKEDLIITLNSKFNSLNDELVNVRLNFEQMNKKFEGLNEESANERREMEEKIGNLKNQLDIINEKFISLNRDFKLNEEKINLIDDNVTSINKKLIKVDSVIKGLDERLLKSETKITDLSVPKDSN